MIKSWKLENCVWIHSSRMCFASHFWGCVWACYLLSHCTRFISCPKSNFRVWCVNPCYLCDFGPLDVCIVIQVLLIKSVVGNYIQPYTDHTLISLMFLGKMWHNPMICTPISIPSHSWARHWTHVLSKEGWSANWSIDYQTHYLYLNSLFWTHVH